MADLRPEEANWRTGKADLRLERVELRLKRPESTNLRPNRSPKGNMWSAIPIALLCMVVNWNERKQGSGPKSDKVT